MSAETGRPLQVEATGETVGEAKWAALRELERMAPGIDKAAVRFQVVSEGERGILGVGYAPARVIAAVGFGFGSGCFRAAPSSSPSPPRGGVREERFGGGAPFFGMSVRVIRPWPTVHRFVVTQ